MTTLRDGRLVIDADGHEIYYQVHGDGPETLLCLHGGPGGNIHYLQRLTELASDRLRVVLFDQLGGGSSDRPDDDSLWVISRFVDEVEAVRVGLQLGAVHVYGRSWGAMLGLQYTLDNPDSVKSLVFSNAGASAAQMVRAISRCRLELADNVLSRMLEHEAAADFMNSEYQELVWEFNGRFLRRSTPFESVRSAAEAKSLLGELIAAHGRPYHVMWGPNEFVVTGNLLNWDVTRRLSEVKVPTLVLTGLYDEQGVDCHRVVAEGVQDSEFVIFGRSSHLILLEKEADAYLDVIRSFVNRVILSLTTAL